MPGASHESGGGGGNGCQWDRQNRALAPSLRAVPRREPLAAPRGCGAPVVPHRASVLLRAVPSLRAGTPVRPNSARADFAAMPSPTGCSPIRPFSPGWSGVGDGTFAAS